MFKNEKKTEIPLPKGCWRTIFLLVLGFVGIYYGLHLWSRNAIPTYIKSGQFTFNAWARDLGKLDFAFTDKGAVVWVHSYYRSSGKNYSTYYYQLDVITPSPKRLIKKHFFTQNYSSSGSSDMAGFVPAGKQFFISNQYFPLQFRSAETGDIVLDEKGFIQKYPALAVGIGTIGTHSDNVYILTTKDGLKYYYYLQSDELLSAQEFEKRQESEPYHAPINPKRKDKAVCYGWALTDKLRGELYLTKQYKSIHERVHPNTLSYLAERKTYFAQEQKRVDEEYKRISEIKREAPLKSLREREERHKNNYSREEHLVTHLKGKIFLNAEVIYGDSTICVVKHMSEVGKNAMPLLSAVSREGKVLWQRHDLRIFKGLKEIDNYNMRVYRQKDEIAIVNNTFDRKGVALIDVQTGKAKWEYVPAED